MTLKLFLEVASILSGLLKLFAAKECSLKSLRGVVASTALPGCNLGGAFLVVFRHVVHSVKQIHTLCPRNSWQSKDTSQPAHNDLVKMSQSHMLCNEPLNVHTSYRLWTVPLRDFILLD